MKVPADGVLLLLFLSRPQKKALQETAIYGIMIHKTKRISKMHWYIFLVRMELVEMELQACVSS